MTALIAKLGEVSELRAGVGFPERLQGRTFGDYPLAKVGDISRVGRSGISIISKADHYVDERDLSELKAKPIPQGSVLFAKIGEAIRQNHRVIAGCSLLVDNNAMAAIPTDRIASRYLYQLLRTIDFYRLASATTVPALRKSVLSEIEIPLPPLAEQKRIAGILDAADALRAKRREALAQLDILLQAAFLDLFGDPVTNPKGWEEDAVLGELTDVASGITKGRKLNSEATREVPYLAVINVQDRHLWLDTVKTIAATKAEIDRYRLLPGDLVLTEGGDRDKLGRGSLWNGELKDCIHQNHIFRVRVKDKRLDPIFLEWLVGSRRGKDYFLRSAKQTTGIASINMTQLRAFPMLVPPLDLQQKFASIVGSMEGQESRMRAHLAELDTLFASLQSRAFKGEL